MTLYVLVSLLEVLGQGGVIKAFFRERIASVIFSLFFLPCFATKKYFLALILYIIILAFKDWRFSKRETVAWTHYRKLFQGTFIASWLDFGPTKIIAKKKKLISLQEYIFLIKS